MFIYTRQSFREAAAEKRARILSVAAYLPALKTWHMLLEAQGYQAISFVLTHGPEDLFKFNQGPYDVIVLGQSVNDADKKKLVEAFRQFSSAPIISVPSRADEPIDGADIHTEPDPEELLSAIASLIQSTPRPVAAD